MLARLHCPCGHMVIEANVEMKTDGFSHFLTFSKPQQVDDMIQSDPHDPGQEIIVCPDCGYKIDVAYKEIAELGGE